MEEKNINKESKPLVYLTNNEAIINRILKDFFIRNNYEVINSFDSKTLMYQIENGVKRPDLIVLDAKLEGSIERSSWI